MDNSGHLEAHGRKMKEHPEMATRSSSNRSFYDSANLQGKNSGAEMFICRNGAGDSQDCCINIYISNNVQGGNNSIMVGSKVKMGDPGVSLCFRDLKLDYGVMEEHEQEE